jgi:hypothetical protein
MRRTLLPVLLAAVAAGDLAAAQGTVTTTVREAGTGTTLPQSAGSWCDDTDPANNLNLARVSTTYIFTDGTVDTTFSGYGYTISGWATDYVPQTVTNVQVFPSTTTVVNFNVSHPVLTLTFSPGSISEAGGTSTATVTLKNAAGSNVTLKNALTITSSSGNTAKATVSQPAQIAAGSSTTTFTVTGVDNALVDGSVGVTITVTAGSWGSDPESITVTDND